MKTQQLHLVRRSKKAFTLIEIMVATVIMIILVGLVIQITGEVLKVWNRSSGKLSANSEARIAMNLLTQDLETAVFRNNGQQWLRVEAPEDPNGVYTDQTVGLKLFSPAIDSPTEDPGGDPVPKGNCAIAYRLAYKESYGSGPNVYALYRMIVDPKTTFEDYMGGPSQGSNSPQVSLTTSGSADWGIDTITSNENYLASNIVEFKVLIYEEDPSASASGRLIPVNTNKDGLLQDDYAFGGDVGQEDFVSEVPPLYAEIILTVVSDQGLELLENIDKIPEDAAQVVREHGEIFTRRVNFMARPL